MSQNALHPMSLSELPLLLTPPNPVLNAVHAHQKVQGCSTVIHTFQTGAVANGMLPPRGGRWNRPDGRHGASPLRGRVLSFSAYLAV